MLLIPVVNERDKGLLHRRVRRVVVCRLRFQIVRRPAGDQLAAINQPDTVAVFRFVHKVGGDHHRDPFFYHAVDVQPELTAGEGIDAGGGFVEKQNVGLMHQRTGQRQTLFKTERQRIRRMRGDAFQAEGFAHAGDFFVLRPAPQAINPGEKAQVLLYRQVAVQGKFLRHIP